MYDYQKVWEYILDQIANGRTLTSIVAEPDMPSYAWCTLQLRNDPSLKNTDIILPANLLSAHSS